MPSYTREIVIGRPRRPFSRSAQIFATSCAGNLMPDPSTSWTMGGIGTGSRFRARWRGVPEAIVEVVAFDPPRSWETRSTTLAMEARTVGFVEPRAGGSRYRIHVELRAHDVRRIVAAFAIRLMARQEDRNMTRIRAALEHGGIA